MAIGTEEEEVVKTDDEKAFGKAFDELTDGDLDKSDDDDSEDSTDETEDTDDDKGEEDDDATQDDDADDDDDSEEEEESESDSDDEEDTDDDETSEKEQQRQRSWEGRQKKREGELAAGEAQLKADREAFEADKGKKPDEDKKPSENVKALDAYPEIKSGVIELAEEVANKVTDSVKESQAKAEEAQAEAAHYAAISNRHPDYGEIYDSGKLDEYIKTQPKSAQIGMNKVLDKGSADEVIQLYDDYEAHRAEELANSKESKGKQKRKQQIEDGSAVRTKGGAQVPKSTKIGKEDFDSSFDMHADKLAKDRANPP